MSEADNWNSLVEPLTRRELDILHLLVENLTNNQIAAKLTLAPSSVKWYVKQIYAKLGVNEREQVARRASELGLIPASQPAPAPKHNLPSTMTPFIGRQGQIEQVRRMVVDPNCRLITLTGAGGVGKTRLALKVAESSINAFKHGVWLAELASVNDPALVDQSVAAVFGLHGDHDPAVNEKLRDYLYEKKLLLVLDNCEHLIDACARLVESLLRSCPELHILVTSREALDIEGEIPFSVPSLTFPDSRHLPVVESLPQYEAIRLLVDRTRAYLPDFSVTESNAKDVARICQRLDGIPLALELAAARVKILGVDQLATHLEESFQLLAGGFRTALPRHQTMRASISWSHQLLSEPERILFRRFSVFAGGWTLEAAKEICVDEAITPYDVIDLLTDLVNKSLVMVENTPGKGIRYYLLDAIWDFAHEKLLETAEDLIIFASHLRYFLNLAQVAEPELYGREQISWLDRLEFELPNLRIALDWGMKTDPVAALNLASVIALFWHIRGHVTEGLSWLTRGLNSLPSENASPNHIQMETQSKLRQIHARSLVAAGFMLRMRREYHKAAGLLENSLVLYQAGEDAPAGLAYALLQLACCETGLGNYAHANELASRSLAACKAVHDSNGVSECLLALGNNEIDPSRAKHLFLEALEIKRSLGDVNGLAYTLQQLCEITVYETDFECAFAWIKESLGLYEKADNKKSVVNCLQTMAWITWITGDYSGAIHLIDQSIALSQEIEEKALLARGLLMKSDILLSQGNYAACENEIQAASKIGHEMGFTAVIGLAQVKLGRLSSIQGQNDRARKFLQEALTLSRSLGDKYTLAFSLYNLGQVSCDQEDFEAARSYFTQSRQLFYEMNYCYWDYIAYTLAGLAKVCLHQGHAGQAARLFGAASRHFQDSVRTISPIERKYEEGHLASIRAILGAENFQRLWEEGFALSTQQAMLL